MPESAREFLRELQKRGVVVVRQRGSHVRVKLGNRSSTVPVHSGDMRTGTRRAILRQLGLEDWL